jgi:hypothetical protein
MEFVRLVTTVSLSGRRLLSQDRAMIIFKKKPETTAPKPTPSAPVVEAQPSAEETEAAHRTKPDSDGKRRRKRQSAEDNRLL